MGRHGRPSRDAPSRTLSRPGHRGLDAGLSANVRAIFATAEETGAITESTFVDALLSGTARVWAWLEELGLSRETVRREHRRRQGIAQEAAPSSVEEAAGHDVPRIELARQRGLACYAEFLGALQSDAPSRWFKESPEQLADARSVIAAPPESTERREIASAPVGLLCRECGVT